MKVREGGRVVNVHALLVAGVERGLGTEILGLQVTSAEDAGWLGVLPGPTAVAFGAPAEPLLMRTAADRGGRHAGGCLLVMLRHRKGVLAVGQDAAALGLI